MPVLSWCLCLARIKGSCPPRRPFPAESRSSPPLPEQLLKIPQDPNAYTHNAPSEPFLFPKLRNYFVDFHYLHLSTRPEAIYLGDLMRLWVRTGEKLQRPRIFRDHSRRTEQHAKALLFPERTWLRDPHRLITRFRGLQTVKKKRRLFSGSRLASPSLVALPPWSSSWLRNFNRIPFPSLAQIAPLTALAWRLGPTYSHPITVHVKPLSTSANGDLIRLVATSTKICAVVRSRPSHEDPSTHATRHSTPRARIYQHEG